MTTPFGPDKLLVHSFEGTERVSGLFHYRIQMFSEDTALAFETIVGKSMTLEIAQSSGDSRCVNGIVSTFAQTGSDARVAFYTADVYPWFWLLTMNTGCAIHQNMSTPDIVKKVFQDLGFSDFTDKLTGSYQPREYCVQYRESAFDFVSRLLTQEGIFYFFTHDSSSHKMVLADDASAWASATGLTKARFTVDKTAWTADDVVTQLTLEQSVTVGQFKCDDYNFETPETDLLASSSGADTSRSVYEFPGLYLTQSAGEAIASLRLAALEVNKNRVQGRSLCRAFYAGAKFTLSGHFRPDANTDYVIDSLTIQGGPDHYSNHFEAFPSSIVFRPPQPGKSPTIPGTQVAVVVGKSGEEIWTDQYGRVKVQFFWDQMGKLDEKSSCWIRVSQPWAGKQWGGVFLPRIGQEVIVSFLDGNPDRPLIIGTLYNASQTLPYTLPGEQTKSSIKSSSSKGGSGFNELRFDDKSGSEELFLQAQKDMNITVLNNYTSTVTKDYSLKVTGNITIEATGSVSIKSGSNFASEAGTELTNKSGTSLTNNAGTELTNQSGTSLTNKAGTTLTNQAAASQTVDGGGMLALKGGLVKVN